MAAWVLGMVFLQWLCLSDSVGRRQRKNNLLKCIEIIAIHISGYRGVLFCLQSLTVMRLY